MIDMLTMCRFRMKEPDQAEIMRSVKRGAPYKKHEEQDTVLAGAPPDNKEVKDDKPEQIVHPIQSKPEVRDVI